MVLRGKEEKENSRQSTATGVNWCNQQDKCASPSCLHWQMLMTGQPQLGRM